MIVLLQEDKSQGLGAIGGRQTAIGARTKAVPWKDTLEKFTKFAAVAVLLLALVLNIIWIKIRQTLLATRVSFV